MSKRRIKKPKKKPEDTPKRQEISLDELKAIIFRAKHQALCEEDLSKLGAAVDTLALLTLELEAKGASIRRLRRLIFGPSTEKTSSVIGDKESKEAKKPDETPASETDSSETNEKAASQEGGDDEKSEEGDEKKRKGHGRNGADRYTGAEKTRIEHQSLKPGDRCPECLKGKVYLQKEPKVLVRVTGVAPLQAKVIELERLRCNLCGEVFTAAAPEGVGEEKYDESAAAMIGLLKYGCGMPFNRLERLEASLGIPLPASTQWEVVEPAAQAMMPVYTELIREAAKGEVLHNDDTTARIVELQKMIDEAREQNKKERTGIFTSGIVSIAGGRRIALFFTGRKHAGENLAEVLKHRADALGPPIQMSDGLAVNTAKDFDTISAECNCHARRNFIDVVDSFPDEVEHVLEIYKAVYKNDDDTMKQNMTPAERLAYHQEHSGPLMEALEKWCEEQLAQKKTEPNSSLGEAIAYLQKHWNNLTLFLRKEGAPLDNNICERALKKAILHRKNALFFKTENGAAVADLFMTLIHTSELEEINPYDYLVALLRNCDKVFAAPENWLPWNYKQTLADIEAHKIS